MLTSETRRKLDSLRDILVGKVPNPQAQVEQITNALIYKYMDDMDQQAIKFGGKASFFTKDYEKYSWKNLMDTKVGAQDRMNIYTEALEQMGINKNLPPIFRDILKGAFLPYRNPETLNLFLHEIDGFSYEHSEELGNAFEYLLSIMGAQGDAGQFRTPRHIIDFIVEVINPTKDDTILDPACGTAGFLISAYKHILQNHDGIDNETGEKTNKEKSLESVEIKKMHNNFFGYDISPEMTKLSRVNMFLHQFPEPKIFEYDTLSSVERWDDDFDVILANPPFMTPKGGIIPHNRFGVQAKRAEVLFVDYIVEHLRPNGRAGIIVPEGIIFQSANAYKQLRKSLVEDGLYAVVSLPAGVFQPYSGVKTSVLLFDKEITKKSDEILFVKIENDGFDLGAQRREIDKNDLPQALEILREWKDNPDSSVEEISEKLKTTKPVMWGNEKWGKFKWSSTLIFHSVKKEKIAENGDYNLTGDRYREVVDYSNVKWDMVELGDVCEILDNQRKPITKKDRKEGEYPYYGATGILDYVENYIFNEKLVLIGEDGAKWGIGDKTAFIAKGKYWVNNHAHVLRPKREKLLDELLVEIINNMDLMPYITGVTVPKLNQGQLRSIKIPLPPLEIQEKIVAEIDGYQKIIDGAKQVVENWKPNIKIDSEWEMVELGDVCDVTSSKRIFKSEYVSDGIPFYRTKEIVELSNGKNISLELFISNEKFNEIKGKFGVPKQNDILISAVGTIGISWVVSGERDFYFKDGNLIWLRKFNKISSHFIKLILDINVMNSLHKLTNGAAYKALTIIKLKELKIPLPSLKTQEKIVAEIEVEQKMVDANKKLIEIYEGKIKEKIGEVWGE